MALSASCVQCMQHACCTPFLQLSFFFLHHTPSQRAQKLEVRFPQTVNLRPQSRTFSLACVRRASDIGKKTPRQRHRTRVRVPCRHQIDSLAFIIPFSIPSFVSSPARHASAASGAPHSSVIGPPLFKCCFRVSASTLVTVLVLWLRYPRLSANPFLECPFFFFAYQRSTSNDSNSYARRSLSAPTRVASTNT
jgi:hypothetical protein